MFQGGVVRNVSWRAEAAMCVYGGGRGGHVLWTCHALAALPPFEPCVDIRVLRFVSLTRWEYPQCEGPDKCPLGCGTHHPPTGVEYCFGCSICQNELASAAATLEPLRPVFLKLALQHVGHLDGFDEADMTELDARLRHVLWLVGVDAVADRGGYADESSQLSKREAISALQYVALNVVCVSTHYCLPLRTTSFNTIYCHHSSLPTTHNAPQGT
jgi:hypothetical protein